MVAVAVFVVGALSAKLNPAWGQVAGSTKAKAKPDAPKAAKKTTPAVAPLAVPGAGKKLDAAALTKIIDDQINTRLAADKVSPSPRSSDAEFLRRAYLDIVGAIPSADKVREFLDSKEPDKRRKVIDELLADPRFGSSLSEVWSGLMIPRESNNRFLNYGPMQKWLAEKFNENTPLDKLVYELLTATGPLEENGAVTFFVGNPTVDKMTDNVSKMFLGVQLQCAQCHNHPFTDWKQTEYWAMAAFFMKTRLTATPQQAAKKGKSAGIIETAGPAKGKKGNLPESAKFVPAKFLQGEQPKLDPKEPYRPVLAKWLTAPENPFFAKAMVNRFWYQLFGRGLVNAVDDMHEDNPASHAPLLAALTEQLKANNFDLKYLYRAILNSEAYQRTSRPNESNKDDRELYSHVQVRVLTPEQLFDSLTTVVGRQNLNRAAAAKGFGVKKGPGGPREQFLAFFRIDEGADPLEYQHGIPQALRLMNSPQLTTSAEAVNSAMKSGENPAQIIERLYLTALSRLPNSEEVDRMTRYVQKAGDARQAYGDILWAMLNSSEFTTNH
jgi:uncharacterized protein DUF1549/uncharacterized protein DUF1553